MLVICDQNNQYSMKAIRPVIATQLKLLYKLEMRYLPSANEDIVEKYKGRMGEYLKTIDQIINYDPTQA